MFTLLLALSLNLAHATPTVVFDLDHTLIDTIPRIVEILNEVGQELDLPTLLSVNRDQLDRVRLGDLAVLGLNEKQLVRVFGSRVDGSNKISPFGRRFYLDPSYLKYDGVVPGAPEFVWRVANALSDVKIVYLSGRLEHFVGETERQLTRAAFPGYDPTRPVATTLILKPSHELGATDAFKVAEFAGLGEILGVFDDSKRNVNAFARILPDHAVIVRLTNDVNDRTDLDERVQQITNYVTHARELEDLVDDMQSCAARLTELNDGRG